MLLRLVQSFLSSCDVAAVVWRGERDSMLVGACDPIGKYEMQAVKGGTDAFCEFSSFFCVRGVCDSFFSCCERAGNLRGTLSLLKFRQGEETEMQSAFCGGAVGG